MKRNNRQIILGVAFAASILTLTCMESPNWLVRTSAQVIRPTEDRAVTDMLAFALNLKSATNYQISGTNGGRAADGNAFGAGEVAAEVGSDVERAVQAIGQLPCENIPSASLAGKTFAPGVYCFGSAELAGTMTLDAAGDPGGAFVFRVNGPLNISADSAVELANGARSSNAYFVSGETLTIGERSEIHANLIAESDLTISDGSAVRGRALSVRGQVNGEASAVSAATGYIEVCKSVAANDPIPAGTIFTFNVAGTDYSAPVGGCTPAIQVTAGNITVIETARENTAVVGITAEPSDRLVTSNLGTRSVVAYVPEGDAANQTIVTFTNQTTRTGTLEICKYGSDTDVTGYFNYTVQGVTPTPTSNGIITVPVGFCSGLITTTLPAAGAQFTANVTELARASYRLEAVETLPINRLSGPFVPDQGFDANGIPLTSNTNGGYAPVVLNEGGPSAQVLVIFHNRSLPGRVKVCKITADPVGIPAGTLFRFTINGLQPTSPTQVMPGNTASITFDVPAGPLAQNGYCVVAPGTWVVGSTVRVDEVGISPNNATMVGPGEVRVSRIRGITGILSSTVIPATGVVGSVLFPARNAIAEVEFTNYLFRPAILKLCATGGPGVTGNFTFTVATADPLASLPVSTAPVTVPVNYCTLLQGPFPAAAPFPGVGTFNLNTRLTITESANGASALISVTSPTNGAITADLAARTGTLTLNQNAANSFVNEIVFNNAIPPPVAAKAARFDFDGDGASDMAVYRNGAWWYAASGSELAQTGIQFGAPGDKLVAADYDGDGKTDPAVYRNGYWSILGTTQGVMQVQFGVATDIPQPGDYDGDGKTDFAVFRPSNGIWYMQLSQAGFRASHFGVSTDRPVAADFDGDGRVDPAVFRGGTWYVLGSTAGFYGVQFGVASDIPVQADYDGDGQTDAAIYRAGTWHVLGSTSGYYAAQFGIASDIPVPADYDGDGKTDFAVYRTSTYVWHVLRSGDVQSLSSGYFAAQMGSSSDVLMNY